MRRWPRPATTPASRPPTTYVGIATPADAAGPVPSLDLWRADVTRTPTADKVALALAAEAATLRQRRSCPHRRVGRVRRRRDRGGDRDLDGDRSPGRSNDLLDRGVRARRRGRRHAHGLRLLGRSIRRRSRCRRGRSRRGAASGAAAGCRAAAHPAAPGGVGSAGHALARRDHRRVTQRGGGREGPLDVRRALRRADRRHERDARRRSHGRCRVRRVSARRGGRADAPRRADRRRRAPRRASQRVHRTARG